MNAPRAGWHPDPTDRHDYRYWDGLQWTDDVADGGVTAIDPVPDDPAGGTAHHQDWGADMGFGQGPLIEQPAHYTGGHARYVDDPRDRPTRSSTGELWGTTTRYADDPRDQPTHDTGDPWGTTTRYADDPWEQPARSTGGFAPVPGVDDRTTRYAGGFGARDARDTGDTRAAGLWADEDRYAYRDPAYRSSTGSMPDLSDRRRPSKSLIAGISLVAIALLAGLAVLLTGGRDGGADGDGAEISDGRDRTGTVEDPATPGSDTTATTAAPETTAPAAPGEPGGGAPTTAPPATPPPGGEGGGGGGEGGAGGGDQEAVDSVARALRERAQGGLTEEQSRCMAQGMVDTLGPEASADLAAGGEPDPSQVSQEDMMALQESVVGCGVGPGTAG